MDGAGARYLDEVAPEHGATPGNVRGRRTKAALLSATRELIEEAGFEAVTMASVAHRAGVTRRALYLHFTGRAELLIALYDHVSQEEQVAKSLDAVWSAPTAVDALAAWASHLATVRPKVLAIDQALERVYRIDEEAAAHRAAIAHDQQASCRRLATWLAAERRLSSAWSVEEAADMLWALMSPQVMSDLLIDREWSTDDYAHYLGLLLQATFVAPETPLPRVVTRESREQVPR